MVLVVVTAYSLTSALGHAALNRMEVSDTRKQEAQVYTDMRSDLERAKSQLSWIPQHRPAASVAAEVDGLKARREWGWSDSCQSPKSRTTREFCKQYVALSSELASAQQAAALEKRIASIQAKLAHAEGGHVMSGGDPQAIVLARLAGIVFPDVKVEHVQTALTVFIALLLEIGSALGMYIAFSQWRLHERAAPMAPAMRNIATVAAIEPEPAVPAAKVTAQRPRVASNDNRSLPQPAQAQTAQPSNKLVAPENDVQLFYKERIETQDGSSLTATALYEDYCEWCEEHKKEPLALPTFGREFGDLGVQKSKIAGRIRYIGISLKSGTEHEEDKKPPTFDVKAA
ncbi:MAG: hypothetical protein AB7G35_02380 [Hyphomicrobiaceae bacterium]